MKKYACNDVFFLPKIFNLMLDKIKNSSDITYESIINECQIHRRYTDLNLNITDKNRDFLENTELQGVLRYFF